LLNNTSDQDIIARVLAKDDQDAFGELVRKYQSDVRRLLRKLTAPDMTAADDLAQETFLKAYRFLGTFGFKARFSTWLYKIAYNIFLDSREKIDPLEFSGSYNDNEGGPPGDVADTILRKIDLERAMLHLNPEEKTALVLFYENGLTHNEIAEVLGKPLGTIKTNILRGKERLKMILLKQ
jgi:RNA polymerase sigma-70 factor (ECF subfamily)